MRYRALINAIERIYNALTRKPHWVGTGGPERHLRVKQQGSLILGGARSASSGPPQAENFWGFHTSEHAFLLTLGINTLFCGQVKI